MVTYEDVELVSKCIARRILSIKRYYDICYNKWFNTEIPDDFDLNIYAR